VGGEDILLAYANGKARVWNVETMEFRRSTGIDAADEMLQSGTWSEMWVLLLRYQLIIAECRVAQSHHCAVV